MKQIKIILLTVFSLFGLFAFLSFADEYLEAPPLAPMMSIDEISGDPPAGPLDEVLGTTVCTHETEATEEIKALARVLQHDPVKIYSFVKNQVDYRPTRGIYTGATGCLEAMRGNGWDQAALLSSLLRTSGYPTRFVYGRVFYYRDDVEPWIGAETSRLTHVLAVGGLLSGGVTGHSEMLYAYRLWVEAQVDGNWYTLDPSFKEYERFNPANLIAAMGYSQTNFLSAVSVGATVTTDSVQSLNISNLNEQLTAYTTNLLAYIRTQSPNTFPEEILGGERIISETITNLPTALPKAYSVSSSTLVRWDHIPEADYLTLRILHEGIDISLKGSEAAGKRLSIFYTAGSRPELYLDGSVIATGNTTTPGSSYTITVLTDHPYNTPGHADSSNNLSVVSGGRYVLVHDLGDASAGQVERVADQLREAVASGLSTNSEAVLGGALYLASSSYMQQSRLANRWLARQNEVTGYRNHWIGLATQTEGFGIDLPWALVSTTGLTTNEATPDVFWLARAFLNSALEHGIFEQTQLKASVSTVRLLCLNNENGDRTYWADSSNWSSINGSLDNYSSAQKEEIGDLIDMGYHLLLPQNADISLEQWEGFGYFRYHPVSGSLAYVISGGSNGGAGASDGEVDAEKEEEGGWWSTLLGWFGIEGTESQEPVDLFTGRYLSENIDLGFDPKSTHRNIQFSRFYDSGRTDADSGLGYGWKHGLDIRASIISDSESALGQRTPYDAVAQAVQSQIITDLMCDPDVRDWLTCSMISQWQMDNLTTNAVRIEVGNRETLFIRQPDGSYAPASGMRATLEKQNGVFVLKKRFGTEYRFRSDGWIDEIDDADSNTFVFAYNAQTNLQTVTDAYGRTLSLTYTGNRISTVSDSTGRQTSYGYDAGNLVSYTNPENNTWIYQYDTNHQITAIIDPENITTIQNHYDPLGCVTQQISATSNVWNFYIGGGFGIEEDPLGEQTTHRFDSDGRNLGTENALGHQTTRLYDGQGHLIAQTDAHGITNLYAYDADHNLLSATEAFGTPEERTTSYGYDNLHRPVAVTNALCDVSYYQYDSGHHLTKITNALNNVIAFEYGSGGLLKKTTEDGGRTTEYSYDSYGNLDAVISTDAGTVGLDYNARGELIQKTDARGQTTEFTYNETGKHLTTVYADGSSVSNSYYDNGLLKETTDGKGQTVSRVWNNAYKLQTVTFPDGGVISNTYDFADRLIATKDAKGNITSNTLDAAGKPSAVQRSLFDIRYSYDPVGNLTNMVIDPSGLNLWIATEYDSLSRPASVQSALSTVQSQYDLLGRKIGITDAVGNPWETQYDLLGRPVKSIRPTGAEEQFVYDALGNRIGFYNADGRPVTFGFDAQSRVTSITNAIGKVRSYSRDLNGNIISRRDAEGTETLYDYDGMSRLICVDSSNSWADFDYDLNSNMISSSNQNAELEFTYDSMNRMSAVDVSLRSLSSFAVTNSYDFIGNRTNIIYPGGLTVTYEYDAENRLESVTTEYAENTESFSFGYDNAGRVTGMSYPNGVNSTFGCDVESRVTSFSHNNGSSNFVQRTIVRDDRGFKTSDDIIQGLEPAFSEGEQKRKHNAADQLTHIDQRDTWLGGAIDQWYNRDYSYNDNGCLIEEDVNRPEWNTNSAIHEYTVEYQYDFDNRLKSITGGLPYSTTEYLYDGSGVRIARIQNSVTNYFVIDYNAPLKMPLVETDVQGNITRYYIWSSHGLLCHLSINPATGSITATRYYHTDEQSSTLALTDETGTVTDQFAYTPYGVATHTGSTATPYQWLGGIAVRAEGSGLYYMLNRTYSAPMRRFISADPSGIDGGVNLYAYGNLNPLAFVDPFGLEAGWSSWDRFWHGTPEQKEMFQNTKDWKTWGAYLASKGLGIYSVGQEAKQLGVANNSWAYAHIFANAKITQQYGAFWAVIASGGKEYVDFAKGTFFGNQESLYSAFQAQDFHMNWIGINVPDGISAYDWAEKNDPDLEGAPGPFYLITHPLGPYNLEEDEL